MKHMSISSKISQVLQVKVVELFQNSLPIDRTVRPIIHVSYENAKRLDISMKLSRDFQRPSKEDEVGYIKRNAREEARPRS